MAVAAAALPPLPPSLRRCPLIGTPTAAITYFLVAWFRVRLLIGRKAGFAVQKQQELADAVGLPLCQAYRGHQPPSCTAQLPKAVVREGTAPLRCPVDVTIDGVAATEEKKRTGSSSDSERESSATI